MIKPYTVKENYSQDPVEMTKKCREAADFFEVVPRLLVRANKQQIIESKENFLKRHVSTFLKVMNDIITEIGLEAALVSLSLEELREVAFFTEKVQEAEKLSFTKCRDLKPDHLVFISECYKDKEFRLDLTITDCQHIKQSDLGVFDGLSITSSFS